ncbi:MAG: HEAT repeat domain-containing protein [Planctomycetota bacterium]|nr:HEAT repeat domain-containing protein [Planctomycetota bacterium]MDA1177494.1 HEAT repeat domain-containing protein [Planctomycetota bacterium]
MKIQPHFVRVVAFAVALTLCVGAMVPVLAETDGAKERELLGVLRSEVSGGEKALACKQLVIHGTEASIPDLAALLADERLASWSRIALEAIPGTAADAALREATTTLQGKLLIGVINSIGVRRDSVAVDVLTVRLADSDTEVAAAAALALGRIGSDAACSTLRAALSLPLPPVRNAVAEGCVLCAERRMHDGKLADAVEIYDAVRRADVPPQRIREATRGAILARQSDGISLLLEQLQSSDKGLVQIALSTARELTGREVSVALASELKNASPERAVMLLNVLADREDAELPPVVLDLVKQAATEVRIAAVEVIGRRGDAESVSILLKTAVEPVPELAQAAKLALGVLPGGKVNTEIAALLAHAKEGDETLPILIELVGQRRIDAAESLIKVVNHSQTTIRHAALKALGETVGQDHLTVLISQAVAAKSDVDSEATQQALRAACVRMPDREACAAELASVMPKASAKLKAIVLEILGAMGGTKALATIDATMKGADPTLQDTGSRVLGEWMTLDAAPVLLNLAKNAANEKHQVRALRGYIRLARQLTIPVAQRAELCNNAFQAARRVEEQQLVLAVVQRYPSLEMLRIAIKARDIPAIQEQATLATLVVAHKLGSTDSQVRELLVKSGLPPVKIEILKAEYGAESTQRDVTDIVRSTVGDFPYVPLPAKDYNASFGGDPAPGQAKALTIHYKIDGKESKVTFPENEIIVLPSSNGFRKS